MKCTGIVLRKVFIRITVNDLPPFVVGSTIYIYDCRNDYYWEES